MWKSCPLQRFKLISKGLRYPKNITNWTLLSSFKGPHGPVPELVGISRIARMKIFDCLFVCFSALLFFLFFSQNRPRKGVQKVLKIITIAKKTPTRSSLEILPAKSTSKVWHPPNQKDSQCKAALCVPWHWFLMTVVPEVHTRSSKAQTGCWKTSERRPKSTKKS